MHTARLETIRAKFSVPTTRCHSLEVLCPQMNMFQHVSSDHHQISLRGDPRSDVWWGRGTLPNLSEAGPQVWCPGGYPTMVPTPNPLVYRQTLVKTSPPRNFVCGRWKLCTTWMVSCYGDMVIMQANNSLFWSFALLIQAWRISWFVH